VAHAVCALGEQRRALWTDRVTSTHGSLRRPPELAGAATLAHDS
jgi:hypothetical protein